MINNRWTKYQKHPWRYTSHISLLVDNQFLWYWMGEYKLMTNQNVFNTIEMDTPQIWTKILLWRQTWNSGYHKESSSEGKSLWAFFDTDVTTMHTDTQQNTSYLKKLSFTCPEFFFIFAQPMCRITRKDCLKKIPFQIYFKQRHQRKNTYEDSALQPPALSPLYLQNKMLDVNLNNL